MLPGLRQGCIEFSLPYNFDMLAIASFASQVFGHFPGFHPRHRRHFRPKNRSALQKPLPLPEEARQKCFVVGYLTENSGATRVVANWRRSPLITSRVWVPTQILQHEKCDV